MRNGLLKAVETALSSGNSVLLGYDDESGLHHDNVAWLEALTPCAPIDQAGLRTGCTTAPVRTMPTPT
jgi:hypothetical protein